MNYIELINRFWQEVEMVDFLPSEACVYFRLLDVCNKLGWQNPFPLSNSRVVALMAMNEKTFRAIRDRLGGRGLIEFRKGKKRESAPMYCFPEKTDEGWIFPWGNFLAVKNTVKNTVNTPANDTANTPVNDTVNTPAYNKTKTINNNDVIVDTTTHPTLDFGKEKKPKRKSRTKEPPTTPTLEEVLEYFRTHAETRLKDWQTSGTLFFDTFNADGWVNKYGRHIQNWDSEANKWIYYQEQREKTSTTNETKQADRFSERRGVEPANPKRKGFKGTF